MWNYIGSNSPGLAADHMRMLQYIGKIVPSIDQRAQYHPQPYTPHPRVIKVYSELMCGLFLVAVYGLYAFPLGGKSIFSPG